jgi:hypothetical protein
MIPEELKNIVDEILGEILSEDGSVSTTASAGGEYNSKYFLKKPKALEGKTPTEAAGKANISSYTKDGFTKVPEGMPSDSKIYDYKQFPAKPKPKSIKLYKEEEQLNEISYRRFNENVSKTTSERKITRALNEVKKRIKEIEQVIEYSQRLKTENTIQKSNFWDSKTEQLKELSERLNTLSGKIKNLSK